MKMNRHLVSIWVFVPLWIREKEFPLEISAVCWEGGKGRRKQTQMQGSRYRWSVSLIYRFFFSLN